MSAHASVALVLDPRVVRELEGLSAELGEDVLGDVVGAFEAAVPALVAELVQAAQTHDFAAAARVAHTLRSAALQVGATGLTELAKRIESEALAGSDTLGALAEECARALGEVQQALSKVLGKRS